MIRFSMKQVNLPADVVALSVGVVPNPENAAIGQMLKVPTNQDGFFLEAHVKLRPVDFADRRCVYVRHVAFAQVQRRVDHPGQRRRFARRAWF